MKERKKVLVKSQGRGRRGWGVSRGKATQESHIEVIGGKKGWSKRGGIVTWDGRRGEVELEAVSVLHGTSLRKKRRGHKWYSVQRGRGEKDSRNNTRKRRRRTLRG